VFALLTSTAFAQVPEWNTANLNKACGRPCLVDIMDAYMNAMFTHNPKAVPTLAKDIRIHGGQIHMVQVFPFVTIPYGLGNGWTPGSGR
jgi:hypothetical protein